MPVALRGVVQCDQFIGPVSLLEIEAFLDSVEDCLIGGFSLTVALRVSGRSGVEADCPSFVETAEVVRNELRTIVGDNFVRETMPADDVFPDEILYLLVGHLDKCFSSTHLVK